MPKSPDPFHEQRLRLEAELGEPVNLTRLAGSLRVFQRKRGHRHSIDDALTAWFALRTCPNAQRYLDLGSGIGTVGLAVLAGLGHDARMTCVEAQLVSYRLLSENLRCNHLLARTTPIHGDLRELSLPEKFDLITGSPPYFPVHAGTLPKDEQKAYARFELRGDVGDYAHTAKRHLVDGGVFVYCFPYAHAARGLPLVTAHGFALSARIDVIPTSHAPPLFSVYAARLGGGAHLEEWPPLIVNGPDGMYTSDMLAIQRERGFGPQGSNNE